MKNNIFKALTFLTIFISFNIEAAKIKKSSPKIFSLLVSNQTNSDIEFQVNDNEKWTRVMPWAKTTVTSSELNNIEFRTVSMIAQNGKTSQEIKSDSFSGTIQQDKNGNLLKRQSFYVYGKTQVLPQRKTGMVTF